MKKFFISAAIVAVAFSVNAQRTEGGVNLVKNCSFDDPGLVQAVPSAWTWEPMSTCNDIETLPDWTLSTGGIWNGGAEVMCDPALDLGDGDTRPDEDYHWLRFYSDTDNMWAAIKATQKITGLEVGKNYKFDFVVCGKPYATVGEGAGSWNQNLTVSVTIAETDGENLGREIKKEELSEIELDWTRRSIEFRASATEIYLQLSMGNDLVNDKHDQAWVGFDCLDMYDPNGVGGAGVEGVVVDENAPVEYFNLQGIRVANPENGVFIRRQGATTTKVAL